MSNAPTLINMPPPPSDPVTPSEMGPGTPNSTTTSMSELSTVAIKDGHRGHLPHTHHASPLAGTGTSSLDAERADRISRLAGLERVTAARQPGATSAATGGQVQFAAPHGHGGQGGGYFGDAFSTTTTGTGLPAGYRERSTVGSASATGSVGGRTTWTSVSGAGSDIGDDRTDVDKMSEDVSFRGSEHDAEMDATSSVGGMSDEGTASLVGFGEGARTPARQSGLGSPNVSKASAVPMHVRGGDPGTPVSVGSSAGSMVTQTPGERDARMIDGMTYDENIVDTSNRTPPLTGIGQVGARGLSTQETADKVVRERLGRGPGGGFGGT